jgi:hypothetical protein
LSSNHVALIFFIELNDLSPSVSFIYTVSLSAEEIT